MTHEALAWLLGICTTIIIALIGLVYRYVSSKWSIFETRQKLNILIIYHLITGMDVPQSIKDALEETMRNGEKR